jgi:hypothetical protein
MNMGNLSIFWCIIQFISSLFYSFYYRSISPPALFLFLGILRILWIELFSWFLSLPIHCWYIRKPENFMLILYPAVLLNVFIRSSRFLVESLGSCIKSVHMLRDNLTSSFNAWIPFICFFCLIILSRDYSTILIVEKLNILVLFLTLREMDVVFPHLGWYWLSVSYIPLLGWDALFPFLVSSALLS